MRGTRRGPEAPDDQRQGSGRPKAIGKRHAAIRSGAQFRRVDPYVISLGSGLFTGVKARGRRWNISIGQLPVPLWLPEVGMLTPTDPVFAGHSVSPKRISTMLVVSNQLLRQQTGPEAKLRGLEWS